jgi:RecJ-like exonuclease
MNRNVENLENILIGYTYVLPAEEYGSHLYDARRFSELLNSCALGMKSGIGLSICLGERTESLEEAERDLEEFKNSSQKLVSKILKEKWRISDKGLFVFISADGIIEPDYVGYVGYLSRLLTTHYQFMNRVIIMKIVIDENYSKYFLSSRYDGDMDVEQMAKELSNRIDGITVTFSNADGQIIIPSAQEDTLMSIISKLLKKISK